MAKQLNKKLVIGLTVGGMVVATIICVVLIGTLPEKDPEYYVRQAEQAIEAGNHWNAARLYSRAWRVSNDPEYLVDAGQAALDAGNADEARQFWQKAIISSPKLERAQQKILEFVLEVARVAGGVSLWQQVHAEAGKLLEINDQSSVGLHAMGLSELLLRNVKPEYEETAADYLVRAVELAPANAEYASSLASYYASKEEGDKAEQVHRRLLEVAPDDPLAHRQFGLFLGNARRFDESLAELTRAVELGKDDPDNLIALAQYWIGRGLLTRSDAGATTLPTTQPAMTEEECFKKAEATLIQAIETDPNAYAGYFALGTLYRMQNDAERAAAVYNQRLERQGSPHGHMKWLERRDKMRLLGEAFRVTLAQVTEAPEDAEKNNKLIEKADRLYHRAIAESSESAADVLAMKGRILAARNEYRDAIKALEDAEQRMAGINPEVRLTLADLYTRVGETGAADKALRELLGQFPNNAVGWAMLARVCNANNNPQLALQMADRALQIEPDNRNAIISKMTAYRALGNWEKVREIQSQISIEGDDEGVRQRLAQAMLLRYQAADQESPDPELVAQAEEAFRFVLDHEPANELALRQLVDLLRNGKRFDEMNKVLDDALAATSAADDAKSRRLQQSVRLLRAIVDPNTSEDDRLRTMEQLVREGEYEDESVRELEYVMLYEQTGKSAQVLEHIKKAMAMRPKDSRLIEVIFRFALREKDSALAEEVLKLASDVNADGVQGHFYSGRYWLAIRNDPARAAQAFRSGLDISGTHSEGHMWLGRALLAAERLDEAKNAFERSVQINPNNALAHVGLAQIAEYRGEPAVMKQHFEAAKRLAPENQWVQRKVREEDDRANPENAIARREQERSQLPKDANEITADNIVDLLQLARLYVDTGQSEKAEGVFRQAIELNRGNETLRHHNAPWSYASYLRLRTPPNADLGLKVLEEHKQGIAVPPKKAEAQILVGRHLEDTARLGLADAPTLEAIDAAYEAAPAIHESFEVLLELGQWYERTRRMAKAEEMFRRAVDKARTDPGAPMKERIATRVLINAMIQSHDVERRDVVDKAIADYVTRFPEDTRGKLLEAQNYLETGRDSKAMEALSQFLQSEPNHAEAYFHRGYLYYRQGKWDSAIEDLRRADTLNLTGYGERHHVLIADAYRRKGQPDAAVNELEGVIASNPDAQAVAQYLVRVLSELGRFDQAEALALRYSRRFPDAYDWSLRLGEILLARKADHRRIIEYFQRAAEQSGFAPNVVDRALRVMMGFDQFDDVIRYVGEVVPADKQSPSHSVVVAEAQAKSGRKNEAIATFEAAMAQTRTLPLGAFGVVVASVRGTLGEDEAMKLLQASLAETPEDAHTNYALAQRHTARAREAQAANQPDQAATEWAEAEKCAKKARASAKEPRDQLDALRLLAQILYSQKQFEACKNAYVEALTIDAHFVLALNNLAYLLLQDMNNPQEALEYSRRAARLDGGAEVQDTYGWNLTLLGRYADALVPLNRAIEADPDSAIALYHRAMTYRRLSEATTNPTEQAAQLEQARADARRAEQLAANSKDEANLANVRSLLKELGLEVTEAPTP
ncbi:MAG: tetratricopeptide repeat protein [Phycisphaerae bacterium]|nr:tetratricopeptide repeat protein [Phycisphaerae bacterium]